VIGPGECHAEIPKDLGERGIGIEGDARAVIDDLQISPRKKAIFGIFLLAPRCSRILRS